MCIVTYVVIKHQVFQLDMSVRFTDYYFGLFSRVISEERVRFSSI